MDIEIKHVSKKEFFDNNNRQLNTVKNFKTDYNQGLFISLVVSCVLPFIGYYCLVHGQMLGVLLSPIFFIISLKISFKNIKTFSKIFLFRDKFKLISAASAIASLAAFLGSIWLTILSLGFFFIAITY